MQDIEKEGHLIDLEVGANELEQYYQDGFGTFDMADHYGSAELITGRLLARYQYEQHKTNRLYKVVSCSRANDEGSC